MTQPADVGRRPLVAPVLPGQLPAGQRTPGGDREVVVQRHRQQLTLDAAFEQVVLELQLRLGGTVVADSTRPRMLLESGLLVRYYLPREDVRTDLLEPSYTTTRCPYKGIAHYWSLREGGHLVQDVAWTYPEPFHDAEAVCGLMCFVDDLVDLEVANDGHPD